MLLYCIPNVIPFVIVAQRGLMGTVMTAVNDKGGRKANEEELG